MAGWRPAEQPRSNGEVSAGRASSLVIAVSTPSRRRHSPHEHQLDHRRVPGGAQRGQQRRILDRLQDPRQGPRCPGQRHSDPAGPAGRQTARHRVDLDKPARVQRLRTHGPVHPRSATPLLVPWSPVTGSRRAAAAANSTVVRQGIRSSVGCRSGAAVSEPACGATPRAPARQPFTNRLVQPFRPIATPEGGGLDGRTRRGGIRQGGEAGDSAPKRTSHLPPAGSV